MGSRSRGLPHPLVPPGVEQRDEIGFWLGKRGDAAETRANKRSPWDTLHPARHWATTENPKSPEQIERELAEHFAAHPVFPRSRYRARELHRRVAAGLEALAEAVF